jgi:hypothetical protein
MIPENGNREEFKASMLEFCSYWPVPGEAYVCTRECSLLFAPGHEILVVGFGFSVRIVNTTLRERGNEVHTFSMPTDTFLFAINTGALKYMGFAFK